MSINKYFGFKTLTTEQAVIDSLLEHSRIDEQELHLLKAMSANLCENSHDAIDEKSKKIMKIRNDSHQHFQSTEEHIIQANFDFQKQYDFLRIYQRIESISCAIIRCSDHIVLYHKLNATLPTEVADSIHKLTAHLTFIHDHFKNALGFYENSKSDIFNAIHHISDTEELINTCYLASLEKLFILQNNGSIRPGDARALELLLQSYEKLGNCIEAAAISLEWLLIT